jgi:hypothetical protein
MAVNEYKIQGKLVLASAALKFFNSASDPGSPVSGDTYYNTTTNKIRYYNGSAWADVSSGITPTFSDSTFRIQDNGDATKQIAFEAAGITTGTTRTITVPDANVDLGALANTSLSNLASTALNASILPATNYGVSLGSTSLRFDTVWSDALNLTGGVVAVGSGSFGGGTLQLTNATLPDGSSSYSFNYNGTAGGGITSSTRTGTTVSQPIKLMSGNTVDGNSGDIILRTGVPTGTGTRGSVSVLATQLDMGSVKIVNLADPTANQDAATKAYVDAASGGVQPGVAGRLALYPTTSSTVDDQYTQGSFKAQVAVSAQTLAADRTYSIPDAGANASFVMTEGAQTVNGAKTFGNDIVITGNLTVNGTTTAINSANLDVVDKAITLNKGGAATTGSVSGLEIEENASITGYARTSADRASWRVKAPASAGEIILAPGASGFTIDQGSHDPVTLTAPSGSAANGATLSAQALTLTFADATKPGIVSTAAQSFVGTKTFTGDVLVNGNITLGDATTDTLTANARLVTDLLPSTTNTRALGGTSNRWSNVYSTVLDISTSAQIGTDLVVLGNTQLGDATSDTVTFNARSASDLTPSTDNTRNLGSSSLRWASVNTPLVDAGASALAVKSTQTGAVEYFQEQLKHGTAGVLNKFYVHAATLAGSTASATAIGAPFTWVTANFKAAQLDYYITEATTLNVRTGRLLIAHDGTNITVVDQSTETADTGVTFSAAFNSTNTEIRFTKTGANDATLRTEMRLFTA